MLLGRATECARIEELLEATRMRRGGALAVLGEPGIGKSALLAYAQEHVPADASVLLATGVESESELAFSSLARLLGPLAHGIDALAEPQARALRGALALGPPGGDRFVVYTAALALLALEGERAPVIAIVDDLHWVDAASREALLFVARRIAHERVALLFTLRDETEAAASLGRMPVMTVTGLDDDASDELLARTAGRSVERGIAQQLRAATRGNPLGLIEGVKLLSEAQLEGLDPLSAPLPLAASVEHAFRSRLEGLPDETRRLLLLASANDADDLQPVLVAAEAIGIEPESLAAAEQSGLVEIGEGVLEWRHPLVRSTAYHSATAAERRDAHRALGEALGDDAPARRAWHLAASALAPDEEIAAALEQVAADARVRGGHAAAAQAFARAARLSPDAAAKARRLLEAASDEALIGRLDRSSKLLGEALELAQDPRLRADVQLLRSRTDLWARSPLDAQAVLLAEAEAIEQLDPARATLMLAEASIVASMTGECRPTLEIARRAVEVARGADSRAQGFAEALMANGLVLNGRAEEALPLLRRVHDAFTGDTHVESAHPTLVQAAAHSALWVGDHAGARAVLQSIIAVGRQANALFVLPFPLAVLAELEFRSGHWIAAEAAGLEASRIAEQTGQVNVLDFCRVCLAILEAGQGRETECLAHVQSVVAAAEPMGVGSLLSYGAWALGLLYTGVGRYELAIRELERLAQRLREHELAEPGVLLWRPDLIESYVQLRRVPEARSALEVLEREAAATNRAWARATAARCRGMLAEDDRFEADFEKALTWHEELQMPFEQARTELRLGERRRRARRVADARVPLRSALATFQQLGAAPWSERAAAELRAAGESVGPSSSPLSALLTAQELEVAIAVSRGATNREVAAALFVSPKTIEFHLGNVYRKLGIRSRSELVRHFLTEDPAAPAGAETVDSRGKPDEDRAFSESSQR
jgi:DNA-binding CsgD family transcriptional regulator